MVKYILKFNRLRVKSMINSKDRHDSWLFDPWHFLGPKRRKLLDESWPGLFRKHILSELPVKEVEKFYSPDWGRPTKELYAALGAVLLQQAFDLTDEEAVHHLAFNVEWHYALEITDESDEAKYLSPKTLWSMRHLCLEHGLHLKMFEETAAKLAEVFGVEATKQRLDSVHVQSNMKRLSRIGLFAAAIRKFLMNLKRQHPELASALSAELVERYLSSRSSSCFSLVKPSESERTLATVSVDLYGLVERFAAVAEVASMRSYQLLARVLREQCEVREEAGAAQVVVKASQDLGAGSLQNPSDPDAGYDSHKGRGSKAQVMETFTEEADPKAKAAQLNLITYVEVQPASTHDVKALVPALQSVSARALSPATVLADSHYGSDENCEAAVAQGVEVVSPVIGGGRLKAGLQLSDFEYTAEHEVARCPAGHAPLEMKKNDQRRCAVFDARTCAACAFADQCPARPGSGARRRYLRYDDRELRISFRRARERTDDFKQRYRWRAGVEATMSALDRRTGIKHLRVRGLKAVQFAVTLKAVGLNLLRATRVQNARISLQSGRNGAKALVLGLQLALKHFFKEHLGRVSDFIETIFVHLRPTNGPDEKIGLQNLKMAA